MSDAPTVVATSRSTIRQHAGAYRSAAIPPQQEPVEYGIHGGLLAYYREKYGFDVDRELPATLDHMIAAVAGWMVGTYAAGLAARGVDGTDNLVGEVEGDLSEVDGVIRITAIRLHMTAKVPEGEREGAERLLEQFPAGCPAYQSVCGSIAISCTATFS